MQEVGKTILLVGAVLVVLGLWLWKGGNMGGIGQLPGDIYVRKGNSTFYFPIVSCILLSILLSLIGWLLKR